MIRVMVSSTIKDMLPDRDAIIQAFEQFPLVEMVGAHPVSGPTHSSSSFLTTVDMAANCDTFVLLLGGRYGFEVDGGRSATEVEFDAAMNADPTKILVFRKNKGKFEPKQEAFATRVSNYYSGFWVTRYDYTHVLANAVRQSFGRWLEERAAIGYRLNYFDHFVRLAIQRMPEPTAQVFYSVEETHVELRYKSLGTIHVVHFDKSKIYSDFWGCIAYLEQQFVIWRKGSAAT